jgi:hypothetical protein
MNAMSRCSAWRCWREPAFNAGSAIPADPTATPVARLNYRILVAADQLDEAQRIIAQPVPQDIIDESKIEIPEYQMPSCPRCHDQEPTLVGTEPSNQWLCESCGNEWAEPIPEPKKA